MVKTVADPMPATEAKAVLHEMLELVNVLLDGLEWVLPSTDPTVKKYGGPVKYVVTARSHLQALKIGNFSRRYPAIASLVGNGDANDNVNWRLEDSIFQIGGFKEKLEKSKYLLKTDADRADARESLSAAIGDLLVFLIIQYNLDRTDGSAYLSVVEHCNAKGITPEVFYGEVLSMLDCAGQAPYGYEVCSKYYEDIQDIDAGFAAECQEAMFPLTEDLCEQLVNKKVAVAVLRDKLNEFKKQVEVREVKDVLPSNMITKLNLG